jgi:ribosomal-protein-alanine N-acetyltransferase
MEKMPYRHDLDMVTAQPAVSPLTTTTDWRHQLPLLAGTTIVLRELRASDAPSLFAMLSTEEVSRFIAPPPTTIEGFERFITWTHRQRSAGLYACFAVTINDTAIGLFQLRQLESGFRLAEWGFAIGSEFWGSGIFKESATLLLEFAFETVGVYRLEARASVRNGRGNGALRKLGAVQEGVLRKSFCRHGEYQDQALWAILADEWRDRHIRWNGPVH